MRLLAGLPLVLLVPLATAQEDCWNAVPIAGLGTFPFDFSQAQVSAFDGGNPLCVVTHSQSAPPNRDVFFQWTATQAGDVTFESCAQFFGMHIAGHEGTGCAATCIMADNTSGCAFTLTDVMPGETFLIEVGTNAIAGWTPGPLIVRAADPIHPNDRCDTAAPLVGVGTFAWDVADALASGFSGGAPCEVYPISEFGPFGDIFHSWTAQSAGDYSFRATSSGGRAILNLHTGTDCTATCVASGIALQSSGMAEVLMGNVQVGDNFLIQLGPQYFYAGNGTGTLEIGLVAGPFTNDTCAGPIPIPTIGGEGSIAFNNANGTNSGFHGGVSPACPAYDPIGIGIVLPFNNDLFFTWSPGVNGTFRVHTDDFSSWGTELRIHLGSDCSAVCLTGGIYDDPATGHSEAYIATNATDTYLIQLGLSPLSSGGGSGDLQIERMLPGNPGVTRIDCAPNAHHLGGTVTLAGSQFGSGVESGLHLRPTGGPPGAFGMMLVGYHSDSAYNFGNGRWCLSWPVARYSQRAANIQGIPGLSSIGRFDASGEFQNLSGTGTSTGGFGFDVPYELPVGAGNTAILPGDQLSFQLWYRDDANSPATGFNLSDMLTATFF